MRYTIKTIGYNGKNFFYVFPLVILPAFLLALTVAREDVFAVWSKLASGALQEITFLEIFQVVSIFNFSSWTTVLFGFLGFIALVVCVSLLMAFTDKHMRFGKRTFNGVFNKLNDNLTSTFGFAVLMFVLYELWTLVLSAVLTLCLQASAPFAYVLAGVAFVAMHFGLTYLISFIYLWLPCMQITGFRTFEALRYAYMLCEPVQMRLALWQSVTLLLAEGVIFATTLFLPAPPVVSAFVTTALYGILVLQFCVRMQIAYFDRGQIERADLKKYYD